MDRYTTAERLRLKQLVVSYGDPQNFALDARLLAKLTAAHEERTGREVRAPERVG
jgi:hypothetical protein